MSTKIIVSFSSIGNLVNRSIKKSGLMYQVEAALVVKKFDEIAIEIWGAEIAKEIKALYIKDKILTVAVLSSAMSSELRFQENEIIKKLNQHFDKELVYKIRFLI